VFFSNTKKLK